MGQWQYISFYWECSDYKNLHGDGDYNWIPAPHFLACLDQWVPFNWCQNEFSNYYINFATSLLKKFLWSMYSTPLIWPNSFCWIPLQKPYTLVTLVCFSFLELSISPTCLSFARSILRYLTVFVLSGIFFLLYYPMDYYWCLRLYHRFLYIALLSINLLALFKLKWLNLEAIEFSV